MKITHCIKTGLTTMFICGLTACTGLFNEINTDNNQPTKATPDLLLNPLLRSLVQNQFNYNNGSALAHHLARTNYNEVEQYAFGTNEGTWNAYYLHLNNIREMIEVSQAADRPSCKAIGYILKAFAGSQLTDLWGNVPYFEAVQGAGNITPSYDLQKDIYTAQGGIIDLLEEAESILSSSNDVLPADIIFAGDRMKWRKLGNSLHLRYLMRISNRETEITAFNLKQEIQKVMSRPLMETNDDNMLLKYLAGSPNKCPIYDLRSGEFEYVRMSDEISQAMNTYQDPRMAVWFAPTTNSATSARPVYNGIPVGCSSTSLTQIGYSQADVSLLGNLYRTTPDACSAVLMNCSEVKFLQAEAITRGYATGDVKSLYEAGVKNSLAYYNIKEETINTYLSHSGVAYNASDALNQIMQQKWLSLFMVGYEAWFDFLRTGLPAQTAPKDNRNPSAPGQVPSRFYYPENEQAVNGIHYKEAIDLQGGSDNINTKLWWEK